MKRPKITALIPCHNEAGAIRAVIKSFPLKQIHDQGYDLEIVVIDNNSSDGTARITRALGATVLHEPMKGKGNAMRLGFEYACRDADYIVMLDGDDTYRPEEILRLVEPLQSGFCDVVIGSRLGGRITDGSMKAFNRMGNWVYSHLVRYFYQINVTDALTGYFAWTRDALEKLRPHLVSSGFAIEMEMVTKMARLGLEVSSVPISYDDRVGVTNLRPIYDGSRILWMFAKNLLWQPKTVQKTVETAPSDAKVAVIANYYPPHVGGLEIVAQKQVESLAKHGHHVSVVTCAHSKEVRGSTNSGKVTVHRESANNILDNKFGIPFTITSPSLIRRLWAEIKNADIVVIHDVFYLTSWIGYIFSTILKKRIILVQHVTLVEHSSRFVVWVQRLVYHTIGNRIFHSAESIVVYNILVRKFLLSFGVDASKILELRNGIDLALYRPAARKEMLKQREIFNLPADKPLVLFVGRFVPKKGFNVLYEARDRDYDIVFVGTGNVPDSWRTSPGVHFLAALSQEKLADLYRAVDIFALPTRGELFTLAMQEAMASGLPVLTTDEPAYKEYAMNRKLIAFVSPNTLEIKQKLKFLVSNPKLRLKMSAYSNRLARERFDWHANIKPVIHLIGRYV